MFKQGYSYTNGRGITHTRFDEVSLQGRKAGKCLCGKRRVRRERFWGTVNPFHRNADGTVRTREQVLEKVKADLAAWEKAPILCDSCPKP